MKVIGNKVNNMVMVHIKLKMELLMLDNGKMINKVVKEKKHGLMVLLIKENTKMD